MIGYIVLAEICKTIGTPIWVTTLCWIGLVLRSLDIVAGIVNWIIKQTNADIVIHESPLPRAKVGEVTKDD